MSPSPTRFVHSAGKISKSKPYLTETYISARKNIKLDFLQSYGIHSVTVTVTAVTVTARYGLHPKRNGLALSVPLDTYLRPNISEIEGGSEYSSKQGFIFSFICRFVHKTVTM